MIKLSRADDDSEEKKKVQTNEKYSPKYRDLRERGKSWIIRNGMRHLDGVRLVE